MKIINTRGYVFVKGSHPCSLDKENDMRMVNIEPQEPSSKMIERSIFDHDAAEEWVLAHSSDCQESLRSLVYSITRIAHPAFMEALGRSIFDIRRKMQVEESKVIVLVENNKSNQWVAELARKHFNFCPSAYYRLGIKEANVFAAEVDADPKLAKKNIVLFDDGSFSGKQMHDHVQALLRITTGKIYVVVPFMTKTAEDLIGRFTDKRVIIAVHERIVTIGEILSRQQFEALKRSYTKVGPNVTVTYFEHKVPNDISFFEGISRGTVHLPLAMSEKQVDKRRFLIIPPILSPYK